jgi:hypothetical protein
MARPLDRVAGVVISEIIAIESWTFPSERPPMIRERTKRSNDEEKSHTPQEIKFPSCCRRGLIKLMHVSIESRGFFCYFALYLCSFVGECFNELFSPQPTTAQQHNLDGQLKCGPTYHGDEKYASPAQDIRQLSDDRRGNELKDRERRTKSPSEQDNVHFWGSLDGI